MKRFIFRTALVSLAGFALWLAGFDAVAANAKPNIILILSDDFGYGDSAPTAAARGAACPRPASTAWRTRA